MAGNFRINAFGAAGAAALLALAGCIGAAKDGEDKAASKVLSFDESFDVSSVECADAKASFFLKDGKPEGLRIDVGAKEEWPGVTIKKPGGGAWDFSEAACVRVPVTNLSNKAETFRWRIDNPGADGKTKCATIGTQIGPGMTEEIALHLNNLGVELSEPVKFIAMNGAPGGKIDNFEPANVVQFKFFVPRPKEPCSFKIGAIVEDPAPPRQKIETSKFFPFVDSFGQYIHAAWPGRVYSEKDLKDSMAAETEDLAAHPASSDWDAYGGWAKGPQLKATGFFRTQKLDGRWWLVDPAGRLFWSHGVDGVRSSSGTTPLTDRRNYFESLPTEGPLTQFYGKQTWAPVGYYKDKPKPLETYNFTASNLYRKYGEGWREEFAKSAVARLKSWRMNTIGNWSDEGICLMRKTPYVKAVNNSGPFIKGSSGYWGQFPDPFAPEFRAGLAKAFAAETGKSAGDPMCVGYFVDNELSWGNDAQALGAGALASPEEQPAKQELLKDLKAKYGSVAALNAAWGSSYASWEALAKSQELPADRKRLSADIAAFTGRIAEAYFKTCREELKKVAPDNMYLGCRFMHLNTDAVISAQAAKYCDVVSFNLYRRDISDMALPGKEDKPVIVGEFHFGALDRGMFHPGLVPVADQNARAKAYRKYVEGALRNPYIVGTHWFLFGDQPTTGRGDGENYQVGLVNICDIPYAETIEAIRETGGKMYSIRMEGGRE